jgi:predicted dehydrogenase
MQKTIRWGIWGTGTIADKVANDFRFAPGNVIHAVASRSEDRARSFAAAHNAAKSYSGLAALVADPDVDVVYIATPNQMHLGDCLQCIEAGKAVLCEKPFALSFAQAQRIAEAARRHGVFCMEAMWTRFLPAVVEAKRLVDAGELGAIKMLQGTFAHLTSAVDQGRLFNPAMGGGVLLDLGVYLISMSHYLLGAPQSVLGSATLAASGVDDQSAYQLTYASGALADLFASLRVRSANEFFIAGERGSLRLHGPFCAAQAFEFAHYTAPPASAGSSQDKSPKQKAMQALHNSRLAQPLRRLATPLANLLRGNRTKRFPFPGNGYQFQLQEVARCLREQKLESSLMPLDDSLAVMRTMDELRAQWGLAYPGE